MKAICLKFYTYENKKHHMELLYEWLLEFARKKGLPGGHAIRGIAGFGHHHKLHEEHFFELGSNVPVEITFILGEHEADDFLASLREEKLHLYYTMFPIAYNQLS
jgi:uncharacterized protein